MLLKVKRYWMTCQLAMKVGIIDFSVCCFIKDTIRTWQTASCWVSHHLTILQQRHGYAIGNFSLEQYHNEGDALVPCNVVLDETWAWAKKHKLKLQLKKWFHSGSPQLTNWCWLLLISTLSSSTVSSQEGWTVNAVHFCNFLQYYQCSAVQWKHSHFITDGSLLMPCDNTPCHVARLVTDLLAWWQ